MYMFYVLIITHLYSNISQASDIFVQNLFVDNYSYLQTTLSTTVSANPDSISILYAFSGASLEFHIVCHYAPPRLAPPPLKSLSVSPGK